VNVKLISVSKPADPNMSSEDLMVYTARVSSPQNQANLNTGARLLRYCMKNGHWSVFEQADMTVEIETSRAISAQILRHRSFSFQEFSQRYAEVTGFEIYPARRQDQKNRQNSTDDLPEFTKEWFIAAQESIQRHARQLYEDALKSGVAKECARFLLPMSATTRLYMKGSVRSWIHYFKVRGDPSTQQEHREIAQAIQEQLFNPAFPTTAAALEEES
jgi:thymidylate synthase (FAD)